MIEQQETTRLEKAILLATVAHQGQIDDDGQPHIIHSLEVMFALKRELDARPQLLPEGYTVEDMMIAAVLHDVPEDTSLTVDDIHRDFGRKIADCVDGVTRRHGDPLCKQANCKEHSKESYRDFIYRAAKKPASKLLKIADLGVNRKRTHLIPASKAKWAAKLEYKYDVSLRVLFAEEPITWEQASWQYSDGKYFVADPNGKKVEVTKEQFDGLMEAARVVN